MTGRRHAADGAGRGDNSTFLQRVRPSSLLNTAPVSSSDIPPGPLRDGPAEPFTPETGERLVALGEQLITALQAYVAAAAAVRSEEDDDATDDVYDAVVDALARFDAAHLDHLEYPAPVGDVDDLVLEADESGAVGGQDSDGDPAGDPADRGPADRGPAEAVDEAVDEAADGQGVTVLSRRDYVITDVGGLYAAATEARARSAQEPVDRVSPVDTVGEAFYELIHHGGSDALQECAALDPTGAVTLFVPEDLPLDQSRMDELEYTGAISVDDLAPLFRPDRPALFSFSEFWG